MDLQLCPDFYAVLTYISDYYGKDDSGTMKFILEALKDSRNESLVKQLSIVAHKFLTHRQIGECEAYYRILPHLRMKDSNIEAVFVATGFKENRSKFLQKLKDEDIDKCENLIEVSGRLGFYTEKSSLIDKYMRRDTTDHPEVYDITYLQFAKRYCSTRTDPKNDEDFRPKEYVKSDESIDNLDFIVTHDFEIKSVIHKLPKYIAINDPQPGEAKFMKIRKTCVARLHKFNQLKTPHEFYYSELQLYRPFTNEEMLSYSSFEQCKDLYDEVSSHNAIRKVTNVKRILMEFLESVEEGTEKAKNVLDSTAGVILDNADEQDKAECEAEDLEEHDDFLVKNPDDLDVCQLLPDSGNLYKKIELYSEEKIDHLVRKLDSEQRAVVDIGVNFAKNLVKAKKGYMQRPEAPLVVVQGGAGTGKSTVIDAMSQLVEKILRSSGDNPSHPYIIKAAFTGTAAANIMGQTMHSAFCFNFGNQYLTLGDKSRDLRRTALENLAMVIIDEYSMIKADMLYQLDLRLRELKQNQVSPFGGVSVFFFGDIL